MCVWIYCFVILPIIIYIGHVLNQQILDHNLGLLHRIALGGDNLLHTIFFSLTLQVKLKKCMLEEQRTFKV